MWLKLITICPIAMDTENFAAAFYYLKAVVSQRCPFFAGQNISDKSHFLLVTALPECPVGPRLPYSAVLPTLGGKDCAAYFAGCFYTSWYTFL